MGNKPRESNVFSRESGVYSRDELINFIQANRFDETECESNLGLLVKERVQEVVDKFKETIPYCLEKWAYLGLVKNVIEERLESIFSAFIAQCDEIRSWEDELVSCMEKEKTDMLENLNFLTKELALPEYVPKAGRFMDMFNEIMEKNEELQFIKQERVSKWTELYTKFTSFCKKLGISEEGHRLSKNSIPSEEQIQELQSSVMELEKSYTKNHKKYIRNKRSILQLCDDLEIDSNSQDIVKFAGQEEVSDLSDSFLKNQESFMYTLQQQSSKNEKDKEMLIEKLDQLWDKLEIDQFMRNQELSGISGWKPSELAKLHLLVEKYEEIKKQNMGTFIAKIRAEIVDLWDRVYASQEERDEFEIYLSEEEYNEALLTTHENELERLKLRYQDNRKLFESLDEWQQCWVKYLDLEKKMNDPNRFNNRGGVLLKQEKEKKRTQKDLARCEKDIRTLADKWSKENFYAPFLVCGQPVLEFIECQKTHYQVYKENEKKEKLKVKNDADARTRKLQQASAKPTPNLLQRTPTKRSNNNTPASGIKSSDINYRLQTSGKPLSPANRELRSTRTRLQVHRLGVENRCNSTDRSRRATPSGGNMQTTPSIPSLVYGGCGKTVGLDQLIGEEQFRAHLQDRKHETLESTGLSKKSHDNSPVNQTFRRGNVSKATSSGYGALNRRKSRSYTVMKIDIDIDEPLYKPTSPKLSRWGSAQSVRSNKSIKSNKSTLFSPRPPFRP